MDQNWDRVNRHKPCSVCGHDHWCMVSCDKTTVLCMWVESDRPCQSDKLGGRGWFHKIGDVHDYRAHTYQRERPAAPPQDWTALNGRYVQALARTDQIAADLGVSMRSLERLELGWDGRCQTFPMRNDTEGIIGIRIRDGKTHKHWCVSGSHQGLFWPLGVQVDGEGVLYLPEGPSDCASLLTLGFKTMGRPSCVGGTDFLLRLLAKVRGRQDVVFMADNDEPKPQPDGTVRFPGQEGAARQALIVRPLVRSVKVSKPPRHKDIRAWCNAGATRETVLAIVENTRFVA